LRSPGAGRELQGYRVVVGAEPTADEPAPARLWRVDQPVRVLAVIVFFAFVFLAGSLTAFGITLVGAACVWLITILVMLFVLRCYLVPYVALMPDRLVVQGVFAHRSVRYKAIKTARPGTHGLRIETRSHGAFTAWAVQKSTVAEWRHRPTVADDVAAAIMDRVGRATTRRPRHGIAG
jgi:hypothetical protein